ncbi:MAG: hypothetical protein ACT4P3_14495 [Betaproteobacteria bacterium]
MITREWPLLLCYATAALFFFFDRHLLTPLDNVAWLAVVLSWLFVVILVSAFAVVRHSECLAAILGEPYGTIGVWWRCPERS